MKCFKKRKNKRLKIFVITLIIFLILFGYFEFYVNPQIISSNQAKIKAYSVGVINSAIGETLQNNDYDDLIEIEHDTDGNVALLSVNSKNVNKLNNNIMSLVQDKLNEKDVLNYSLPLGAFSGIASLAGIGPNVNLKIVPIGNISTQYRSQIVGLSINQSYHKIYLTIKISICIILPIYTQTIEVFNQVLVAENIIVGKIPSTYLNTDNLTNALNLIP